MVVFRILERLVIGPLELFFEILFSMVNQLVDHPGFSIVGLSLAMNFLVLPLYKRADAMQEEERETHIRLSPMVKHIKKTFSGDERFMILQTYYRQNNYKPTDVLKGSVSLLLEIPFFMAAYRFLSGLPLLYGAGFGPIENLGAPDGLLVIGNTTVNVLPILMTAINLVSSAVYTKGAPLRSKVQLYGMAGLFLVLLYDSPSGLVFYWTLNNLFSLCKNIFMKLPNPGKVFAWLSSAIGAAALAAVVLCRPEKQLLLAGLSLLLQLPLAAWYLGRRFRRESTGCLSNREQLTFWLGGVFLTVLLGVFIPAGVVSASPEEFINPVTHTGPLRYILSSGLTAAGFFLVWAGIFYLLAGNTGKKWMGVAMNVLCVAAAVNFLFFGKNYGTMSAELVFDNDPVFLHEIWNLVVLAVAAAAVWILWRRKQELLRGIVLTAALAATVMSSVNLVQIQTITREKMQQIRQESDELPVIPLSREGKNVIVLMLDRGISAYVPYLLDEKPVLREQFAGFTYYPNTVSFGGHTNFGAPALYGGYEYTPTELNRRDQEPLAEKHDEALKVMPVIFLNEGYEVTVCDPPYAGYHWVPDLSIFDDYPGIHTYNSMRMVHTDADVHQAQLLDVRQDRVFFCYSMMKTAPVCMQEALYDGGRYHYTGGSGSQKMNGLYRAEGVNLHFSHAYGVLSNLSSMTEIREDDRNTFLMLTNDTTHEPTLLQLPEYTPSDVVDNRAVEGLYRDGLTRNGQTLRMETDVQVRHYHINMAAFLKLGEWFDYLRQEEVFDNTRIILVSDHGSATHQLDHMRVKNGEDMMFYNPLLMVKDFGSREFRVDMTFMTNADTPTLAMDQLIYPPVNPFTGCLVENSAKQQPQRVCCSHKFDIWVNNGTTFLPGPWYAVQDNVFDLDNWEYLGVE